MWQSLTTEHKGGYTQPRQIDVQLLSICSHPLTLEKKHDLCLIFSCPSSVALWVWSCSPPLPGSETFPPPPTRSLYSNALCTDFSWLDVAVLWEVSPIFSVAWILQSRLWPLRPLCCDLRGALPPLCTVGFTSMFSLLHLPPLPAPLPPQLDKQPSSGPSCPWCVIIRRSSLGGAVSCDLFWEDCSARLSSPGWCLRHWSRPCRPGLPYCPGWQWLPLVCNPGRACCRRPEQPDSS